MRAFEFQIRGLTRKDLRRQTKKQSPHSGSFATITHFWKARSRNSQILIWILGALTLTYLFHGAYLVAEKHGPSTIAYGQVFTGKNVIVLEDISGSMGPEEKSRLAALLNQLRTAGIKINATTETMGAGFWVGGEEVNSLKSLEKALRINPTADTIFVFSDFKHDDPEWDDHDPAGFQRLKELLEQRNRRLYLGTVNLQPDEELIRIATDSGGGLLEIK